MHGFLCSHEDWRHQLAFFSKTNEVVACDLRGHGATPGRPEECSIEHFGGDVMALVSNLELENPILVGHSMGCRVVLGEPHRTSVSPDSCSSMAAARARRPGCRRSRRAKPDRENGLRDGVAEELFRQMFFQSTPATDSCSAPCARGNRRGFVARVPRAGMPAHSTRRSPKCAHACSSFKPPHATRRPENALP